MRGWAQYVHRELKHPTNRERRKVDFKSHTYAPIKYHHLNLKHRVPRSYQSSVVVDTLKSRWWSCQVVVMPGRSQAISRGHMFQKHVSWAYLNSSPHALSWILNRVLPQSDLISDLERLSHGQFAGNSVTHSQSAGNERGRNWCECFMSLTCRSVHRYTTWISPLHANVTKIDSEVNDPSHN